MTEGDERTEAKVAEIGAHLGKAVVQSFDGMTVRRKGQTVAVLFQNLVLLKNVLHKLAIRKAYLNIIP